MVTARNDSSMFFLIQDSMVVFRLLQPSKTDSKTRAESSKFYLCFVKAMVYLSTVR